LCIKFATKCDRLEAKLWRIRGEREHHVRGDDILVQKKFLGGKISRPMSPLASGGQRHEGCENCMVRAKPFYLSSSSAFQLTRRAWVYMQQTVFRSGVFENKIIAETFSNFEFLCIWILELVMVNVVGYHLRVPLKMVIVKNLDNRGSLCQKSW